MVIKLTSYWGTFTCKYTLDAQIPEQNIVVRLHAKNIFYRHDLFHIIYARETLNCSLVDWFVVPDSVAIEVSTNIGSVNIACIYCSQALGRNQNQSIIKSIGKLAEHNEETIIYSDFNLTDVDWFAGYVNVPADSVNKTLVLQRDLMDQVLQSSYSWYITDEVMWRRMVNGKLQESTLDQIFSTNDAMDGNRV